MPSSLKRSVRGFDDPLFPAGWRTTHSSYSSLHSFFQESPITLSTKLTRSCLMLKYSMGTILLSFDSDKTSTALETLPTTVPLSANTKSPTFIDVNPMGLSLSILTICTSPCFISKYIPTTLSLPKLIDDAPELWRWSFSEIIVYIVPGGRGALLATRTRLLPLSLTISAALRALRSRWPLMLRHSNPGRSAVPSKGDPGTIFSMTTVPVSLRKARPTFSLGVRLMMVEEKMEGMVKGSSPLTRVRRLSESSTDVSVLGLLVANDLFSIVVGMLASDDLLSIGIADDCRSTTVGWGRFV
mmetsp:Transcript_10739/g.22784  ORF Transcript_10739/g.22784 Transcript_10739/m.22784 type:complete len:299 (+) Transcript_10739:467-1363(+)